MSESQPKNEPGSSRWESFHIMMQQTQVKQGRDQAHVARMRAQEEAKALRKARHEAKMLAQEQQKSRRRAVHLARMHHQEHRRVPPSIQGLARSANAFASSGSVSGSSSYSTSKSHSPSVYQLFNGTETKKEPSFDAHSSRA